LRDSISVSLWDVSHAEMDDIIAPPPSQDGMSLLVGRVAYEKSTVEKVANITNILLYRSISR
jgi:hypothetical protein